MSGVNIGNGAVVAAKALVVRDVAPFEIVGGNPAKHLRFRFDQTIISSLEGIAWWNWPDQTVASYAHLLASNEINEFIAVARSKFL